LPDVWFHIYSPVPAVILIEELNYEFNIPFVEEAGDKEMCAQDEHN